MLHSHLDRPESAVMLSRQMRGGLAGAGTATVPWGHGSTRPPTPPSGVESPLYHPLHQPFINHMQTASLNSRAVQHYMLYIYIEVLIAIYTQVCKIRLTVLRDSCSQGFIHFMK
jgi:hypothetical protein